MSDQRPDDETLGRALGRAVESQSVRETPFERSRLSAQLARPTHRSFLMPLLAGAAAILLGLTVGTALFDQRDDQRGPVASDPSQSPAATVDPARPSPSETPRGPIEELRIFFIRDELPPEAATVRFEVTEGPSREGYISARLRALAATEAPPQGGYFNPLFTSTTKPAVGQVRIEGDLARVDYSVPGGNWGVPGTAASFSLLQQLVYTASEEPGIRRVLITQNGGQPATIDQITVTTPRTREDVLPYEFAGTREPVIVDGDARPASSGWAVTAKVARGVTRLAIQLRATTSAPAGSWSPKLSTQLKPNPDEKALPGKWLLELTLPGTRDPRGEPASTTSFQGTPLRALRVATTGSGTTYVLALDDARPWRLSLAPVQGAPAPPAATMQLNVDLGGHFQSISDSVAVYEPEAYAAFGGGPVDRTVRISGAARAFEANVSWRLKDSAGRIIGTGFVTASLGTSPVWGTFETKHTLPEGLKGSILLEVFWTSPRDGRDTGLVSIPLEVR